MRARVKRIADLPIIVLSSVDASESKVQALEQYAEDYITKPFDPDELVARVAACCALGGRAIARLDGGEVEIDLGGAQGRHGGWHPALTPNRGAACCRC